jgi:hypothetical protein
MEEKACSKSCGHVYKSSRQQVTTKVSSGVHMMIMKNKDCKPRKPQVVQRDIKSISEIFL